MLEGLFLLLVLSGSMGLASFFCGILPLTISLSNRQLRLVSALGTGILISTALAVIVPEGIQAIYEAGTARTSLNHLSRRSSHFDVLNFHGLRRRELEPPGSASSVPEHKQSVYVSVHQRDDTAKGADSSGGAPAVDTPHQDTPHDTKPDSDKKDSKGEKSDQGNKDGPQESDPNEKPPNHNVETSKGDSRPSVEAWIALSLVSGFALMYLVDTVPKAAAPRPKSLFHVSLPNLSRGFYSSSSGFQASSTDSPATQTLTMGLLVHAFADGIALGAASVASSSQESISGSSLSFILFLAIILHKGPAAFSMAALLLRQGAPRRSVKNSILVFSLAAPAGAILTWLFVTFLSPSHSTDGTASMWPGSVLLFSGGTFLYVAGHALHDDNHHSFSSQSNIFTLSAPSNPYDPYSRDSISEGSASPVNGKPRQGRGSTRMEILLTVIGMFLPPLAMMGGGGHSHNV